MDISLIGNIVFGILLVVLLVLYKRNAKYYRLVIDSLNMLIYVKKILEKEGYEGASAIVDNILWYIQNGIADSESLIEDIENVLKEEE